jgi:hypothetical protein
MLSLRIRHALSALWCFALAVSCPTVFAAGWPAAGELKATVGWIGNTLCGEPMPQYVPLGVDDISVSGDGIVATNSGYNESATSVVTFKDGEFYGQTNHEFGGLDKRSAVAQDPDNEYLFYSVYRRLGTGVGRSLCSGKGDPRDVVKEVPGTWPNKGFAGRIITGLAVRNGLLFVSDATPSADPAQALKPSKDDAPQWQDFSGVSVVDKRSLRVLRSFPLEKPGKLAATHDGNVWVVQGQGAIRVDQPVRILKLSGADGSILAKVETVARVGAIAVDGRDRLLVGDLGPNNNIKIFTPEGQPAGSFGMPGGIFAGPAPGLAGPARFEKPRGLGVDAAGNLYVLSVGAVWPAAIRIECYAPAGDTWGERKWQILGMMFGDAAVPDPEHEDTLYTSHAIFKMDWSRPPGLEWSYYATTLDRIRYADDPRRGIFAQGAAGRGTFGIRTIHGRRFLFSGLNNVEVSRLDGAGGTIAVPAAYVCLRDPAIDRAAADWPRTRPKSGGWIWHDSNGNGQYDADEYEPLDTQKAGISGVSAVDAAGAIWWFPIHGTAAHVLPPAASLDAAGNPIYRAASIQARPMPGGFCEFGLCHLDDTCGDLYVVAKRADQADYALARYTGWRDHPDTASATWAVEHVGNHLRREIWIPKVEEDLGALTAAGDYVFLAAAIDNAVRVFRKSDGEYIGRLTTTLSHNTTFDDQHGFHVYRRAHGEYVLILMDYLHNKNLMYRWHP